MFARAKEHDFYDHHLARPLLTSELPHGGAVSAVTDHTTAASRWSPAAGVWPLDLYPLTRLQEQGGHKISSGAGAGRLINSTQREDRNNPRESEGWGWGNQGNPKQHAVFRALCSRRGNATRMRWRVLHTAEGCFVANKNTVREFGDRVYLPVFKSILRIYFLEKTMVWKTNLPNVDLKADLKTILYYLGI